MSFDLSYIHKYGIVSGLDVSNLRGALLPDAPNFEMWILGLPDL